MARISRLLSDEVVKFAEEKIKQIGRAGIVAIKLRAVVASSKYGITETAKIFDTTKATLISWIKLAKEESFELLKVQAGRGRKKPLTDDQEYQVKQWIKEDSQITIDKLKQKIKSEMMVDISRSSVHRIMKKLDYSYITARSQHYKQDSEKLAEAKKKSN